MAARPNLVECPRTLWRVGRLPEPLNFSTIDPEDAATERGGNRFDVPSGAVLYAASEPAGAFGETLARFRPTAEMRLLPPEEDEHLMAVGAIPADWRTRRQIAQFSLEDPLPFLNVDAPSSHSFLTSEMASHLVGLSIDHLDVAAVRGSNRMLTRAIAAWAYVASDDEGRPLYSGLRYESRLGPYECWAIFDGVAIVNSRLDAIAKGHPALVAVAREFDLSIH